MQIKKISYSESITVPNPAVKYQSNKYTVSAEAEITDQDDRKISMAQLMAYVKGELKQATAK